MVIGRGYGYRVDIWVMYRSYGWEIGVIGAIGELYEVSL